MAPAARAAAESLACAVCAALPAPGKKLRSCELCKQRGLPATYYCSEECQMEGWPGHRAWHKEQKKWRKERVVEAVDERQRATAKLQARTAERTGSKYSQLLAAAVKHAAEHDYRRAARKYREAIALEPLRPSAYFNLGVSLQAARDIPKAAEVLLRASELYTEGSEHWAMATACAFDMLQQPVCAEEPKPDWWHDGALKALSAQVLAAAPNDLHSVKMRAAVLSGGSREWEAGPRTAAEVREAAKLGLRAATLVSSPAEEREFIDLAATLNEMAAHMEAAEAAARADEAAVAAAAQAKAEAEAEEAAAALLAEVEVEKAASATQPSGKGQRKKNSKGKGKR